MIFKKGEYDLVRFPPGKLMGLFMAVFVIASCGVTSAPMDETSTPDTDAAQAPETDEEADASGEDSRRGQGETLRLFYHQAPTMLNPHLSQGNKDLNASRIVYEPLASFDKDGNIIAFLAADIPSVENGGVAADGTSVTWKLKSDVFWSDGEPFSADDVLFTFEYITNPDVSSTSAGNYALVQDVEVIDDTTVKINFSEPTAAWFLPFTGPQGMIIPRHIFEGYNGANFVNAPENLLPVGTGPYFVSEYEEEDILIIGTNAVSTIKIIFDNNPYFREPDQPYFENLELQGGGDINLAVAAVKDGLVDFAWNIRVDEDALNEMEAEGNAVAVVGLGSFVERIMINFTDPSTETADGERSSVKHPHPFFTDEAVRQALMVAIDREAIAAAYGRAGLFATNILMQPPFYASADVPYEYNPTKAAQILEDAGWVDSDGNGIRDKDGVELRVVFQTSIEPLRQIAQDQVKADLEAIGFEVELKTIDSGVFFGTPENTTDTRRQFYADLEEFAFNNKSPDPAPYMAAWTCAEIAQADNDWSGANWSRYCNPEYDVLFEEALIELDPDRRIDLFVQMNELLIEDAAVIPMVHRAIISGADVDLLGIEFTAWDVETWNIANWYREEE